MTDFLAATPSPWLLLAQAAPEPTLWHWVAFGLLVVLLLTLDLFVFHRNAHEPTLRESALWTVVWCAMALAFNGLIWVWRGHEYGVYFLTGYLVEWMLSIDNVFVFAVIFNFFGVPLKHQYRVLFWGIIGAILMRLTFILLGASLMDRFEWVSPFFGVILIWTGFKLARESGAKVHPENNVLMRLAKRFFRVAHVHHGQEFFVIENGRRCVTPLFLVLLVVESTDVLFAVDSVPAILSITTDKFTVFTSNIFAILGLRALYFLLAGIMDLFRFLNYGLSGVLIFLGAKMIYKYWTGIELCGPLMSLGVILTLLAIAIVASIVIRPRTPDKPKA